MEDCVHLIISLTLRVQYFLRCEDADLSKLLNFFTFLPTGQIADLMSSSDMSKRLPHKKLAGSVNIREKIFGFATNGLLLFTFILGHEKQ